MTISPVSATCIVSNLILDLTDARTVLKSQKQTLAQVSRDFAKTPSATNYKTVISWMNAVKRSYDLEQELCQQIREAKHNVVK